ncbi:protein kinase C [Nephila pilipes]|uniref:Protein kinase C n=1 Tax=Nephila pilipes TaxID=299642 RepID=A0A8X6UPR0_NEPPI|nr:protein kinase C [Nephila pilipes]
MLYRILVLSIISSRKLLKVAFFLTMHFLNFCFDKNSSDYNEMMYLQNHSQDVGNFDRQFTSAKPVLTPADKIVIMNIDQSEFADFSYFNPEFVAHV